MDVIIKRSKRRKKTIHAKLVDGKIIVMAPASISETLLQKHVCDLKSKLEKKNEIRCDIDLRNRARHLNQKYFHGDLMWKSIKYTSRQKRRRGSCNYVAKRILISHRLAYLPQWVEDYVIVHELAHLIEPNHGSRFKELVKIYPLAERAIGFLIATETLRLKYKAF